MNSIRSFSLSFAKSSFSCFLRISLFSLDFSIIFLKSSSDKVWLCDSSGLIFTYKALHIVRFGFGGVCGRTFVVCTLTIVRFGRWEAGKMFVCGNMTEQRKGLLLNSCFFFSRKFVILLTLLNNFAGLWWHILGR